MPVCVFTAAKYLGNVGVAKDADINVGELANNMFKFDNGGVDTCPINNVMKYADQASVDSETGETVSMADFTVTNAGPGEQVFYFRVGSEGNVDNWSELFTLTVTVCGEETMQASDISRAINLIYKEGDDANGQVSWIEPEIY